jgi:hypothetical protein
MNSKKSTLNSNIMKIKSQLNSNINVDNLYANSKPIIKPNSYKNKLRNIQNKMNKLNGINRKSIMKPTKYITYKMSENKSQNSKSSIRNVIYIILIILILFFIAFLLYNLYIDYIINKNQHININYQIQKAPSGVIIGQAGAPISVEKSRDITENKYLSLYGGDDFIKRVSNPSNLSNPYSTYPNITNEYDKDVNYSNYKDVNYSNYKDVNNINPDNGVTKNYYENNLSNPNINNYINEQNNYIKRINERVRQINNSRMYSPEYSRDKKNLEHIRNYERLLANQVNQASRNQPYLSDAYI